MPNTMTELRAMPKDVTTFRFRVRATIDETPVDMMLPAAGEDPRDAETTLRRALERNGYESVRLARAGPITDGG